MNKSFSTLNISIVHSIVCCFYFGLVLVSCNSNRQSVILEMVKIEGIHDDQDILRADSFFLNGKLDDAATLFKGTRQDASKQLYCQARLAEMDYYLRVLYGKNHKDQVLDSVNLPAPVSSIDSFLMVVYDFYSQERMDTVVFMEKWGRVLQELGSEHFLPNMGHAILGEYFYRMNFNDELLTVHFKKHQEWCKSLTQKIYDGYWTNVRLSSSGTYSRNHLVSLAQSNELIEEKEWRNILDSVHLSYAYSARGYIQFRFDKYEEAFDDNELAILLSKNSSAVPVFQEALKSQLTVTNLWGKDSLWNIYNVELKRCIEKEKVDYVNYPRHVARYYYERDDFKKSLPHHALAIDFCLSEAHRNEPVLNSLTYMHSVELEKSGRFSDAIMIYRVNEIKCEDPFWTYQQLLDSNQILDKYHFVSLTRYAHIYYSWYLATENGDFLEKSEELALKGHELYYRDVETRDENALVVFSPGKNRLMEVLSMVYAEKYLTLHEKPAIEQYHRYSEENRGSIFWKDMKSEWSYDSLLVSYLLFEQQLNAENKFLKSSKRIDPDRLMENLVQLDLINQKIKNEYPEYFHEAYKKETPFIGVIQDSLAARNASLISLDIIEDNVYLLWINESIAELFKIPFTAERKEQLNLLIQWMSTSNDIEAIKYSALAFSIWDWLIPAQLKEDPNDRWVIIPDGLFHRLNLEALGTDTSRSITNYSDVPWLLLKKEIIYSPLIKSWLSSDALTQVAPENVVGFSWSDQKTLSKLNRTWLVELPGSLAEMESLNAFFPGASIYSGNMATKQTFVSSYTDPNVKLMEIALHGKSTSNVRDDICLYFRDSGGDIDTLYGYELSTMDSKVETILLTACETGMGKVVEGEGNFNFARYFLANGAKVVMTSLWEVDDIGAFSFESNPIQPSNSFNLPNIVRNNKIKMINSGQKRSHPFYWAAFSIYT